MIQATPNSTIKPSTLPSENRNLVAIGRRYFGLIVATTIWLTAWGVISMLRMPSGIYPEVSFPEIAVDRIYHALSKKTEGGQGSRKRTEGVRSCFVASAYDPAYC